MRVEPLVLGCIAVSIVRAGPIPNRGFGWLLSRQLNATKSQPSIASPSSSAARGGQIGIVPAIGVNPENTSRLTIVPIDLATLNLGGGSTSSRATASSVAPGLARSNATSTAIAANSSPTGKGIGIVPAVPNDPMNSPPLTTIASIDPAIVSSLALAGPNTFSGNNTATAVASQTAANTANTAATKSITSSSFGVSVTTFPLIGGGSPQPAAAPQPSNTISAVTSSKTLAVQPVPLSATLSASNATLITTTLMVIRTATVSKLGATQPAQADSTMTTRHKSKHHHPGNRSGTGQASIQTAPSSPSGSPLLIVPDIATMTSAAPRTITIAPPQGSGVAIVPVNPVPGNVNANAATITVTETVAETTQTFVIISTTTVAKM